MSTRIYALFVGADEPEFFRDNGDGKGRAAAILKAEEAIKELFDPASLQYGDDVLKVYVTEVIGMVTETDRVDRPPPEELDAEGFDREGIDWSDGQEYYCDYAITVLPGDDECVAQSVRVIH